MDRYNSIDASLERGPFSLDTSTDYSDNLPYPDYANILSSQDRQCLLGLSPSQTRAWTLRRIDQYRDCILALCSIHNLATPLHTYLPTEILVYIFTQIRPTSRKDIGLAHVCRLWRSVLLRTSKFWANMLEMKMSSSSVSDNTVLPLLLERSYPRNLSVYVSEFPPVLYNILHPHFARLTQFKARISLDNLPDLYEALKIGMPSLEILDISLSQHGIELARSLREARNMNPDLVPQLNHTHVPCLRTLVIPGFLFTASSALPSLQNLDLSNCSCHFCKFRFSPRLAVLLRALEQAATSLKSLKFQRYLLQHTQRNEQHPVISFPYLEDFAVWESVPVLRQIIASISPPPTASLQLRVCTGSDIPPFPPFCLFLESQTGYRAILSSIDTVYIKVTSVVTQSSASVIRGYSQDVLRLVVNVSGQSVITRTDSTIPLVEGVAHLFRSAAVEKLGVELVDGIPGQTILNDLDWHLLFTVFPHISTLEIAFRHHCSSAPSLLHPIQEPTKCEMDASHWDRLSQPLCNTMLTYPSFQRLKVTLEEHATTLQFCRNLGDFLRHRLMILGHRLAYCDLRVLPGRCYAQSNLAASDLIPTYIQELFQPYVDELDVSMPHVPLHSHITSTQGEVSGS